MSGGLSSDGCYGGLPGVRRSISRCTCVLRLPHVVSELVLTTVVLRIGCMQCDMQFAVDLQSTNRNTCNVFRR